MKKGQEYIGTVIGVDFPNKGKVQCEDGIATVKNAIPGQTVRFIINKKRGGRCEGRLIEVMEKSPLESVSDCCEHFGVCGGCTYQSIPYEAQLDIKKNQVKAMLDAVSNDYIFEGIIGSPEAYGYRNKMEFSFGDEYKDGPLSLGMHKRDSFYDVTAVEGCRIVDEDYRRILRASREYFADSGLKYYHKIRHEGYLRHLLVRKARKTGEIMVDLVTSTQDSPDLSEYVRLLLELELDGRIVSILNTRNDSLSDVVRNDGTDILYGRDYIYEELLGLRFKITPFSFFQTNTLGAEVLYSKTREYVGQLKDKVVFDLYSGTGTIAQVMAGVASRVVGVEIVEEAVRCAKENAAYNGLDNCEFIAGDVLKVVGELEDKPDIIILDPPRDGIHPKAIGPIIDFGVDTIVYISCKPTSLARDAAIFEQRGYKLVKACCVDMFPGTGMVETVALLSLKTGQPKLEVTMEVDSDSNYTPEERATYQKIKAYVKDKYGVNVHTSYIAQVKRICGLDMGENYNKSKKENPKVKQCPQEKVKYIKDALRYFKLI